MPVYEVRIEPLEPLLFGDNRSARTGIDHLQRDQNPSPMTIHGAIGRFLAGCSREDWPAGLLGEEQEDILNPRSAVAQLLGFSVHGPGGNHFFPRPLHLRCTLRDSEPRPADLVMPRENGGARASAPWPKLPLPDEDEPLDEAEGEVLLSETALETALCGERPQGETIFSSELFRPERRPGIAVDNGAGNVFEGAFFTRPYRRFKSSGLEVSAATAPAGFAAWIETLAPIQVDVAGGIGFLGGDRRRARFDFRETGPVVLDGMCERIAQTAGEEESAGFILYLLTPALVPMHSHPARASRPGLETAPGEPGFEAPSRGRFLTSPGLDARADARENMTPIAAALGKPDYASGWDVKRRRPRPIRALIPAGSVYFFEWPRDAPPGPARAEWVRRLWLRPLYEEGAAAGFGRCLPGIWR